MGRYIWTPEREWWKKYNNFELKGTIGLQSAKTWKSLHYNWICEITSGAGVASLMWTITSSFIGYNQSVLSTKKSV